MSSVIEARGLGKRYGPRRWALRDCDLELWPPSWPESACGGSAVALLNDPAAG